MKKILILLFSLNAAFSSANHLRSGEISYTHMGGNNSFMYEVKIKIYADAPCTYFIFHLGDGSIDSLLAPVPNMIGNIYEYILIRSHTYPASGIYGLYLNFDYLVDSITNLPNSSGKSFGILSLLHINPNINPKNNSPIFMHPQEFHQPCCSQINYNPLANDADGDSLSYSLLSYDSSYSFVGASMDSVTGDLSFTPPNAGKYLFQIEVSEWRTGQRIGSMMRQVLWDVDSATAVEDINTPQPIIIIYPNPLTSSSILQFNRQLNDAEVVIYDMPGKEMLRKRMNGDKMEIEKESLASGVYFVWVREGERQWVEKMIVE